MSKQLHLIEPISILTNNITSFLENTKISSNLNNISFEKIYQLTLIDLAKNISEISKVKILELSFESDNTEVYYKYIINNFNYFGVAVKKFALNLAMFLKTEDFERIHPLYLQITDIGEKLILETQILNSDESYVLAYK